MKANTITIWAKRHKWNKRMQKKNRKLSLKKNDKVTNVSDGDKVTAKKMTESQKRKIVEKVIKEEEKEIKSQKKRKQLTL